MNGMGKNNIEYHTFVGYPDNPILEDILDLYNRIFSDADINFFNNRLIENANSFFICAYYDNKIIGFKIGYPYKETTFYSWIGGVLPNFRRQGIAAQLAKLQEDYAKQNNFHKLRTKSMNQYKSMMILSLKNGFDIVKYYTNTKGQAKIVFEKYL